ncbi:MAG: hypothetical protein F6K41_09230 [Symploca sp. SIO3E6]|nr:hypothetical protein [Caldora sp. SIO3E6]
MHNRDPIIAVLVSFRYSQFPIPNSQFPIPNSQFSILHSPFSILHSPFPNEKRDRHYYPCLQRRRKYHQCD